jgi:hypothetical protein
MSLRENISGVYLVSVLIQMQIYLCLSELLPPKRIYPHGAKPMGAAGNGGASLLERGAFE